MSHTRGNKTRHKPSDSKNITSSANPYGLILEPVQMYSSHTNMKEEHFLITIDENGKTRMISPCNFFLMNYKNRDRGIYIHTDTFKSINIYKT